MFDLSKYNISLFRQSEPLNSVLPELDDNY